MRLLRPIHGQVLVGVAALGPLGAFPLDVVRAFGDGMMKVVGLVMRVAPVGAIGAMAFTLGRFGLGILAPYAWPVASPYLTFAVFVAVFLGGVLRLPGGLGLRKPVRCRREEMFVILGTTSTEAVLTRPMARLGGRSVATPVIARWKGRIDHARAVLDGRIRPDLDGPGAAPDRAVPALLNARPERPDPKGPTMPTLTLAQARTLAADALERCGTLRPAAESTARALVAAEADGLRGHGLSRVPAYGPQVRAGKVAGGAQVRLARPRPGLVAVDAGHGFAYPALDAAVAALPEMARAQGVAGAGISRSHHCGAAGLPVEALAGAGCVALLFANTPAAMAPWGGAAPVLGTNPLAFACPLPGRAPLVIDLALSRVARSDVVAAARRTEAIPEGWALDAHGRPTTDPRAALAGTMLPLGGAEGGAKGAALALMVELLAAGLTGGRFAAEAGSFLDAAGAPPGTGQLILALDAAALSPAAPERFLALAASIEAQAGARLPGARRLAARARAEAQGLDVPEALAAEIAAL